ncbi:MAG: hypothetical protein ACOYNZ_08220 [Rhodoferax sp.]
MLKLFQSIFGGKEEQGRYPETLIEMAIERAVDGTYPRLRAMTGYKKRLREPVIHAIDHVIALVDRLPEPLPAISAEYGSDPRLAALFVSPEHMREVFGRDPVLSEFRDSHPEAGDGVTTLLVAKRQERNIFGVELQGEAVRRDVAQVSVGFDSHRLVDPHADETEARRLLKRRAFDHLLGLALSRISEAKGERAALHQQRELLNWKLRVLKKGGWNFEDRPSGPIDARAVQLELEEIEKQMESLSVDDRTLSGQLDVVTDLLSNAEKQLWAEPVELHLDRMNIKRDASYPDVRRISLPELHNARGENMALLLVSVNPRELPQRDKSFANADRLL